jgi:hypothetical protein
MADTAKRSEDRSWERDQITDAIAKQRDLLERFMYGQFYEELKAAQRHVPENGDQGEDQ